MPVVGSAPTYPKAYRNLATLLETRSMEPFPWFTPWAGGACSGLKDLLQVKLSSSLPCTPFTSPSSATTGLEVATIASIVPSSKLRSVELKTTKDPLSVVRVGISLVCKNQMGLVFFYETARLLLSVNGFYDRNLKVLFSFSMINR